MMSSLSVVLGLRLILMLSGDIELNPGPGQPPELDDVFRLLKPYSTDWQNIGRGLRVAKKYRDQLFSQGVMKDEDSRLEDVLNQWILSECSEVSWDNLIEVLQNNQMANAASKVKEYLLNDDTAKKKYQWKDKSVVETKEKDLPAHDPKQTSIDNDGSEEAEEPSFTTEMKEDIIKLKNPQAQPCKETELHKDLQKFCQEVKIIVHTVNDNEKWAALNYMNPPEINPGNPLANRVIDLSEPNSIALGMFAGYKCAMIQSEMGVDCNREVEIALEEFPEAKVVLAIGVAFACNPMKVKYGDVLVSKVIDGIGNIKHTNDRLIICRASSTRLTDVPQKLKNVFARGQETWIAFKGFKCTEGGRHSKVHSGVLISDRTLIDNQEIRDKMVSNTPEAIGGEMEGVSLVGIQHRLAEGTKSIPPRDLEVIVIKGAADFANGEKGKKWQFTAAMAAANYAHHKLEMTGGNLFIN